MRMINLLQPLDADQRQQGVSIDYIRVCSHSLISRNKH